MMKIKSNKIKGWKRTRPSISSLSLGTSPRSILINPRRRMGKRRQMAASW
jgi:hypothetical protein